MRAAGVLILANNLVLFVKRSPSADHPLEWCFPGGGCEDGETFEATATRECEEEVGFTPESLSPHTRATSSEAVDFTTFLTKIESPFVPVLDSESVGYAWAPVSAPPEPLHPGCRVALDRFEMDELGLARAMASGDLSSPQVYKNVYLWNIRITGTGVSYRKSIDEYVFRNAELYLNDDFLARCNGLTVLAYHPATPMQDSEEFAKRVVGSIFLPYIRGDEVWGIAKIYDDEMNAELVSDPASTSPAVMLAPNNNFSLEADDGKKILIEGKPALLDHVALLPKSALGVWDKGEGPNGVDRSGVADAETSSPLDLSALSRVDSMLTSAEIRFSVFAHRRARRSAGNQSNAQEIRNG